MNKVATVLFGQCHAASSMLLAQPLVGGPARPWPGEPTHYPAPESLWELVY